MSPFSSKFQFVDDYKGGVQLLCVRSGELDRCDGYAGPADDVRYYSDSRRHLWHYPWPSWREEEILVPQVVWDEEWVPSVVPLSEGESGVTDGT